MSDEMAEVRVMRAAQEMYRAAWTRWCATDDEVVRVGMQKAMDAVQPWCTRSGRPDADWKRFCKTLPGYLEYWDATIGSLRDEVLRRIRIPKALNTPRKPEPDPPKAG